MRLGDPSRDGVASERRNPPYGKHAGSMRSGMPIHPRSTRGTRSSTMQAKSIAFAALATLVLSHGAQA